MNDVILINRFNPDTNLETKRMVTIIIGEMHKKSTCDKALEVLEKLGFVDLSKVVLRYNGIIIPVKGLEIPKILTALLNNDLNVYSVYEIYE